MNPLQLLQTAPAEQLHHNLKYIDRNKGLDFVADALRPGGESVENTLRFLYSAEENYDAGKVREIAGFVNGFDGLEKITDEEVINLGFEDVKTAIIRHDEADRMKDRFSTYGLLTSFGILADGVIIALTYPNSSITLQLTVIGFTLGCPGAFLGVDILGEKLSKTIEGDQKPKEAYASFLSKASKADEFLQVYNMSEKLNYRRQPE